MNNADTFAYVAGFSFRNAPNMDNNFKALNANLEKSRSAFRVVLLGAGTGASDRGNIAASQALSTYLTGKGIQHQHLTPEGGAHAWASWRGYWADFMTTIFKDN